jgi:hypothetical protein
MLTVPYPSALGPPSSLKPSAIRSRTSSLKLGCCPVHLQIDLVPRDTPVVALLDVGDTTDADESGGDVVAAFVVQPGGDASEEFFIWIVFVGHANEDDIGV